MKSGENILEEWIHFFQDLSHPSCQGNIEGGNGVSKHGTVVAACWDGMAMKPLWILGHLIDRGYKLFRHQLRIHENSHNQRIQSYFLALWLECGKWLSIEWMQSFWKSSAGEEFLWMWTLPSSLRRTRQKTGPLFVLGSSIVVWPLISHHCCLKWSEMRPTFFLAHIYFVGNGMVISLTHPESAVVM